MHTVVLIFVFLNGGRDVFNNMMKVLLFYSPRNECLCRYCETLVYNAIPVHVTQPFSILSIYFLSLVFLLYLLIDFKKTKKILLKTN